MTKRTLLLLRDSTGKRLEKRPLQDDRKQANCTPEHDALACGAPPAFGCCMDCSSPPLGKTEMPAPVRADHCWDASAKRGVGQRPASIVPMETAIPSIFHEGRNLSTPPRQWETPVRRLGASQDGRRWTSKYARGIVEPTLQISGMYDRKECFCSVRGQSPNQRRRPQRVSCNWLWRVVRLPALKWHVCADLLRDRTSLPKRGEVDPSAGGNVLLLVRGDDARGSAPGLHKNMEKKRDTRLPTP